MPRLSEASAEYAKHLIAKKQPLSTVKGRSETVRAFVRAVGDLDAARVEPHHVDQFFTVNSHWSPGTYNNRLSHLNLFFKWCRFRRYMPPHSHPTFGLESLDYDSPDRLRIPRGEWPRLFAACEDEIETIALATGLYMFLRGSEQQRIQLKDIDLRHNKIYVNRVKSKKRQWLPIVTELRPYIIDHLIWCGQQGFTDPDHYFIMTHYSPMNKPGSGVFEKGTTVPNPNRPICRPYDTIKKILGRAGYETYWQGVHTLRRSGARAMFDSYLSRGYDGALMRVQTMLGHAKAQVTERYLGVSLNEMLLHDELAGKPMFPEEDAQIVPLRAVSNG